MQRGDQCAELTLFHVLQFVDEQHQGSPLSAGRLTSRLQQGAQIAAEIPAVCNTGIPFELHIERHVAKTDLHRADEPAQGPQRTLRGIAGRGKSAHFQQGGVQRSTEQTGQRTILRRFQENSDDSATFRVATDSVQQDGLADPP